MKRKSDETVEGVQRQQVDGTPRSSRACPVNQRPVIPPPTDEELNTFFATINLSDQKPGILRVLDDYAEYFIPDTVRPEFPEPLDFLYDPTKLQVGYLDLLNHCETVFDQIKVGKDVGCRTQLESCHFFPKKLYQLKMKIFLKITTNNVSYKTYIM